MFDKVLLTYLIADGLFVASGGLLIAVAFIAKDDWVNPTAGSVASTLLLMQTPLTGTS